MSPGSGEATDNNAGRSLGCQSLSLTCLNQPSYIYIHIIGLCIPPNSYEKFSR